jgi:hypothetical protein
MNIKQFQKLDKNIKQQMLDEMCELYTIIEEHPVTIQDLKTFAKWQEEAGIIFNDNLKNFLIGIFPKSNLNNGLSKESLIHLSNIALNYVKFYNDELKNNERTFDDGYWFSNYTRNHIIYEIFCVEHKDGENFLQKLMQDIPKENIRKPINNICLNGLKLNNGNTYNIRPMYMPTCSIMADKIYIQKELPKEYICEVIFPILSYSKLPHEERIEWF